MRGGYGFPYYDGDGGPTSYSDQDTGDDGSAGDEGMPGRGAGRTPDVGSAAVARSSFSEPEGQKTMPTSPAAAFLHQEARALLTRLDQVRPFALHETMVPAATPLPTALSAVERFLLEGRHALRQRVLGYLWWQAGPGAAADPREQQRRFTLIRLEFNDVLSQFDLFTEVITQRSEHQTGVWLSGLDILATDALQGPGVVPDPPPVICYLARGPGAAIRRARTRLPGGGANPVALVRVPRERMVGHGIASSLVHEVGHQGAALLGLMESLRPALLEAERRAQGRARSAWQCWGRWISEIVADLWSVATLGVGSTLGLIGVLSLPRWFVFRPSGDDPHPVPWIRVRLSCTLAVGESTPPRFVLPSTRPRRRARSA